jgi:hypothetical protein
MGTRNDFGRLATNYLVGHTGIPDLRWKYAGSLIEAPAPYSLYVTGNKSTARLLAKVREHGEDGLGAVISRIGAERAADSYVVMNLRAYAVLLGTHYEAVTLPRIQQGKE